MFISNQSMACYDKLTHDQKHTKGGCKILTMIASS